MKAEAHAFDRREGDVNVRAVGTRVASLEERVHSMDTELKANTRLTMQVHRNTEEIVALMESARDMWEFLTKWGKRFAIFSKYLSYVLGAIAAFWAVLNLRK